MATSYEQNLTEAERLKAVIQEQADRAGTDPESWLMTRGLEPTTLGFGQESRGVLYSLYRGVRENTLVSTLLGEVEPFVPSTPKEAISYGVGGVAPDILPLVGATLLTPGIPDEAVIAGRVAQKLYSTLGVAKALKVGKAVATVSKAYEPVTLGATFGGLDFAKSALNGEPLANILTESGKGFAVGATLGTLPKVIKSIYPLVGAEVATVGMLPPLMEGRMPNSIDIATGATIVGGLKGLSGILRYLGRIYEKPASEIQQDIVSQIESENKVPTPEEVMKRATNLTVVTEQTIHAPLESTELPVGVKPRTTDVWSSFNVETYGDLQKAIIGDKPLTESDKLRLIDEVLYDYKDLSSAKAHLVALDKAMSEGNKEADILSTKNGIAINRNVLRDAIDEAEQHPIYFLKRNPTPFTRLFINPSVEQIALKPRFMEGKVGEIQPESVEPSTEALLAERNKIVAFFSADRQKARAVKLEKGIGKVKEKELLNRQLDIEEELKNRGVAPFAKRPEVETKEAQLTAKKADEGISRKIKTTEDELIQLEKTFLSDVEGKLREKNLFSKYEKGELSAEEFDAVARAIRPAFTKKASQIKLKLARLKQGLSTRTGAEKQAQQDYRRRQSKDKLFKSILAGQKEIPEILELEATERARFLGELTPQEKATIELLAKAVSDDKPLEYIGQIYANMPFNLRQKIANINKQYEQSEGAKKQANDVRKAMRKAFPKKPELKEESIFVPKEESAEEGQAFKDIAEDTLKSLEDKEKLQDLHKDKVDEEGFDSLGSASARNTVFEINRQENADTTKFWGNESLANFMSWLKGETANRGYFIDGVRSWFRLPWWKPELRPFVDLASNSNAFAGSISNRIADKMKPLQDYWNANPKETVVKALLYNGDKLQRQWMTDKQIAQWGDRFPKIKHTFRPLDELIAKGYTQEQLKAYSSYWDGLWELWNGFIKMRNSQGFYLEDRVVNGKTIPGTKTLINDIVRPGYIPHARSGYWAIPVSRLRGKTNQLLWFSNYDTLAKANEARQSLVHRFSQIKMQAYEIGKDTPSHVPLPLDSKNTGMVVFYDRLGDSFFKQEFETLEQAKRWIAVNEPKYSVHNIDIGEPYDMRLSTKDPGALVSVLHQWPYLKNMLKAESKQVPGLLFKDEISHLETALKTRIGTYWAKGRLAHRKDIAGYSENIPKALNEFITVYPQSLARRMFLGKMHTQLDDLKAVADKAYTDKNRNANELRRLAFDAKEIVDYWYNQRAYEGQFNRATRQLLYIYYLGAKASFAVLNWTQRITSHLPVMYAETGDLGKAMDIFRWASATELDLIARKVKSGKPMKQVIWEYDKLDRKQKVVFLRLLEQGRLSPARSLDIRGADPIRVAKPVVRAIEDFLDIPGRYSEMSNRLFATLAGLKLWQDIPRNELLGKTIEFNDRVNFVYNSANRAKWGRGALAMLTVFKSYPANYFTLMANLFKQDKKAFALGFATVGALAGVAGIPLVRAFESMYDNIVTGSGIWYNIKDPSDPNWLLKKEKILDVISDSTALRTLFYGVPSLLGVEGALYWGFSDLFSLAPQTVIESAYKSYNEIFGEEKGEFGRSLLRLAPVGVRKPVTGLTTAFTGEFPRAVTGKKRIDITDVQRMPASARRTAMEVYKSLPAPSVADALLTATGFRAMDESTFQRKAMAIHGTSRVYRKLSLNERYARAIVSNNEQEKRAIIRLARDYGVRLDSDEIARQVSKLKR